MKRLTLVLLFGLQALCSTSYGQDDDCHFERELYFE